MASFAKGEVKKVFYNQSSLLCYNIFYKEARMGVSVKKAQYNGRKEAFKNVYTAKVRA